MGRKQSRAEETTSVLAMSFALVVRAVVLGLGLVGQ